jgi:ribosomal protein S18 acetylase RimI-like enzyme
MTTQRARLDPMTETEYLAFLDRAVAGYAQEKVAVGTWTAEEALGKSRAEFDTLLPAGLATPDSHLFVVRDPESESGERVGELWFALRGEAPRVEAFIYGVEVGEEYRGRGYGRATMLACSEAARALGASTVGLHVFGNNIVARSLYTSLGFAETGVLMNLTL